MLIPTICPFCGVGCGLLLDVEGGKVVRVIPEKDHIVSKGKICGKGATAHKTLYLPGRLTRPLKRVGDSFVEVGWNEALNEIVERIKEVKEKYGGKAIAIYGGCQNSLEEVYLMSKLIRFLGSNNVDSCARICHEPSATALKEVVGIGASGTSVEEIPNAKVLVIAGEQITESHPVLTEYLIEAKKHGTKIIVIDPRFTKTAKLADLYIPVNQGTDVYLYNAVGNYLIKRGLYDEEFVKVRTKGFEEYAKTVSRYTLEEAERITGVPKELIIKFAEMITIKPTIFSWGLGLSEGGGINAIRAFLNLMLLTGNVGIKGAGPIVYRGQSNVQGSGDLLKPWILPNGPLNEENAKKLGELWGFEIPLEKGLTVTDALLTENDIRAVILVNYNVAHSLPNKSKVIKRLKEMDLVVVLDSYMTDTAKLAHYVLPVAMWAESEGSVVSLDRLVKWRFKAVEPPGEAKQALWVLAELAERLGLKVPKDPKVIFEEMKKVVKLYSSLKLEDVMDHSKNSRYPNGEIVLYEDKFYTSDGFAHFIPVEYRPVNRKGLVLITGRIVTKYNTDTLTTYMNDEEDIVYLNAEDMKSMGIKEGQEVILKSECGEVTVKAKSDPGLKKGYAFMINSSDLVNYVVCDILDPETRIPYYKSTEVVILSR
ncbi:formate dehydrogenase subunit alpha [Stygiolobus azoricus]|uniref:Formate dehydrogenase subunit alpha n=1 Tax=Stygiolobus azoricus TaxID=41675 RepID=A0A650CPR2_9CREN|nr:formate dehydrogenase subunit alpha [Stygiolobus azoricus]QGR19829.1 formate dehydrogenase subunit alpha [Stygiolobus azoricus]